MGSRPYADNTILNRAFDYVNDALKVTAQSPDKASYVQDSILDTTNVAAGSFYYPSSTGISMDGYKDMSLTGKFIDADGTITATVEATNDEDIANADWVQIYGQDSKNSNFLINNLTVTSGSLSYAWVFPNLNYSSVRVKVSCSTATNTVIIKMRRKSF